jgi:MFS family permease
VLALFAAYERRHESPLVPMELFGRRSFAAGVVVSLFFFGSVASFFLVMTFFLQYGLGYTPLRAGLTTVPFSLGVGILSIVAARLAPRLGRIVVWTGALVMATGIAGVIATIEHYGPYVDSWQFIPAMACAGAGMGLVIAPLADIILAGVERRDAGAASGVINTAFQVGNALGIAIIGAIFVAMLGSQAPAATASVAPALRGALATAGAPAAIQDQAVGAFQACLHDRVTADDPAIEPASCHAIAAQQAQLPPQTAATLAPAFSAAATEARERAYGTATQHTLAFQVGLMIVTFLLMLLLPARTPRNTGPAADKPS